jgi:hypothetical protein
MYKHYFRCAACRKHAVTFTEEATPWVPARTHGAALEAGASPAVKNDDSGEDCLGVLSYCSGVDPRTFARCGMQHGGSERFEPPEEPKDNPEWTDFVGRVAAAWAAFVESGYDPARRGANNNREYRAPGGVRQGLQRSGGVVSIGGAAYVVSNSRHADVSLHRPIPAAYQVGNIRSFIFHL